MSSARIRSNVWICGTNMSAREYRLNSIYVAIGTQAHYFCLTIVYFHNFLEFLIPFNHK